MAEKYIPQGTDIGVGAFGVISLVQSTQDHRLYARKSIQFDNENELAENLEEIKILADEKNRHPHIVQLIDHFPQVSNINNKSSDIYYLIFEYCEEGNLKKLILSSPERKLDSKLSIVYLKQIADALDFLHNNRIIHRDIKPENILLGRDPQGHVIIKLADFGLSKLASKAASTMKGTPYYMAPEILGREEHYTSKVDMWALGCTYYEMITGDRLFNSRKTKDILDEIEMLPSRIPIDLNELSRSILTGLLQKDPAQRLTAGVVLAKCKPHTDQLDTTRYFDNLGNDHAINNFDGNHIPNQFVRDSYGANDSARRSLQERGIPEEQPPFSLASHSSSIARKRTLSPSSSNNSLPRKSSPITHVLSDNEDTYAIAATLAELSSLPTATTSFINTSSTKILSGHKDSVFSLVSLGDDSIASGSADKSIKTWNISTEKCDKTLTGHSRGVRSLLSLGGGLLASGSDDNTIKIWNIATGRCERTLQGHTETVWCLSFLGDGRIASGSGDKTIKLWSITRGNCEMTLTGHTWPVCSLVSLKHERIVSGDGPTFWDGSIKIWNILTSSCEITLTGHTRAVSSLVSLEGGRIASGSWDESIKIWNLSTGNCEQTLTGHSSGVWSLVSLGGGRFASGSLDKSIKIWSLASGLEQTLVGHSNAVRCLLSLEGGRRIISGSDDKTIRVWDI